MAGQHSHEAERSHGQASAGKGKKDNGSKPVLVVDDERPVVDALRTALELEGYRVLTAGDGMEAYNLIKAGWCRCMLLDIHMPRISGVELLLLMQAEGLHVPTIVMAAFEDFKEREMKDFSNVVKFLPKPFRLEEMVAAVREHARG